MSFQWLGTIPKALSRPWQKSLDKSMRDPKFRDRKLRSGVNKVTKLAKEALGWILTTTHAPWLGNVGLPLPHHAAAEVKGITDISQDAEPKR